MAKFYTFLAAVTEAAIDQVTAEFERQGLYGTKARYSPTEWRCWCHPDDGQRVVEALALAGITQHVLRTYEEPPPTYTPPKRAPKAVSVRKEGDPPVFLAGAYWRGSLNVSQMRSFADEDDAIAYANKVSPGFNRVYELFPDQEPRTVLVDGKLKIAPARKPRP